MARLDQPNDLEMPALRNSCPICKVENTAEIRSWPFSDRELCCTIGIRTFLFGMVSFSNFHFTKRERCFSVKNEIFQEKILALSRISTDFQGVKVEIFNNWGAATPDGTTILGELGDKVKLEKWYALGYPAEWVQNLVMVQPAEALDSADLQDLKI